MPHSDCDGFSSSREYTRDISDYDGLTTSDDYVGLNTSYGEESTPDQIYELYEHYEH